MQLRHPLVLVVFTWGASVVTTTARADDPTEAAARLTFFREPSTQNKGITVIHPQVDVAAPLGAGVGVAAGWEADAVSGAVRAIAASA